MTGSTSRQTVSAVTLVFRAITRDVGEVSYLNHRWGLSDSGDPNNPRDTMYTLEWPAHPKDHWGAQRTGGICRARMGIPSETSASILPKKQLTDREGCVYTQDHTSKRSAGRKGGI